ncbi:MULTISPECIES: branched-chain amino acid transport system II carrier protein [unclassified Gemella]|uniref:branched-chain amino acid transport system II carrier protein n=1 Tax=unclassified Gemella TaxID=2624949 RepID=UPI001D16630F|nr:MULTISPECIES: branched-chain amino acid transport system II carrier protein [unclassified Gemella]
MKFFKEKPYISIGFMLFAMFFGAGNLIFPAFLGQNAGTNLLWADLGLIFTGVGLPLVAVLVVGYSGEKDLLDLSSRAGRWFGLSFTTLLYLTIGPFFAIPRTGTTTYDLGVSIFVPEEYQKIGLALFLAFFMGLSLWLSINPGKLVDRIGTVITPVLLLAIVVLIIASLVKPMGSYSAPTDAYATSAAALSSGILEGYNTMDVLAALVFGNIVMDAVRQYGVKDEYEQGRNTLRAAVIASGILGVIYVFISNIGATSLELLGLQKNGAGVLTGSINYYFGTVGNILLFVIVFLACLTTSVGLITACSIYLNRLFPKVNYKTFAIAIAVFSFAVGNYGLTTLIQAAVPVLVLLYPLSIVLVILGFANNLFGGKKEVYVYTMVATLIFSLYTTVSSTFGVSINALDKAIAYIPLNEHSFGWLTIALLGFIIGLVVSTVKSKK